jgi:hypothetical protein
MKTTATTACHTKDTSRRSVVMRVLLFVIAGLFHIAQWQRQCSADRFCRP